MELKPYIVVGHKPEEETDALYLLAKDPPDAERVFMHWLWEYNKVPSSEWYIDCEDWGYIDLVAEMSPDSRVLCMMNSVIDLTDPTPYTTEDI